MHERVIWILDRVAEIALVAMFLVPILINIYG